MIYFVTGNPRKFANAKTQLEPFGIEISQQNLSLVEIQSDQTEVVAKDKAQQAYAQLRKPLFVNDVGWEIPAIKGFPGPYMKSVAQWFSPEQWLALIDTTPDRTIFLAEYVVFVDQNSTKVFSHRVKGFFLKEIYQSKNQHFSIDRVITIHSNGKSIAECKDANEPRTDAPMLWQPLGKFLRKHQSLV